MLMSRKLSTSINSCHSVCISCNCIICSILIYWMALVFSSRSWESSCLGLLLLDLSICGPPNCFPQSFKLTTVTFVKMTMLMISDMMIVIYQLSRASLLTLWTTKLWRSIVDNDNYQSDDDVLRWLFFGWKNSWFLTYMWWEMTKTVIKSYY